MKSESCPSISQTIIVEIANERLQFDMSIDSTKPRTAEEWIRDEARRVFVRAAFVDSWHVNAEGTAVYTASFSR